MKTLLVANRAEIACRILRTAEEMGLSTVAIATDADRDARHVRMADRSVRIDDYLSIASIIDAAKRTGADAIHPGYGFLAENAAFAEACAEADIVFVGPPAEAIRLMGSKRASKERMIEANVPCVPGYNGSAQDGATLSQEAAKIGFPLMIKASAGGGGKGLRRVSDPAALADQLDLARSEAESAFGDGELILERAIERPRHVEIQVFADQHGNVMHLGERDCSVQRRHQKIIEESPSPAVTPEIREAMGRAAVDAARSIGYVGAGTVEFLLDEDGSFYFMEMNTRLQVEHPVTELVTGEDLVRWQLDIAAGGELSPAVAFSGHAIEARIYAEDPSRGFLPQTGVLSRLCFPDGVRVDHGLVDGQAVTADYDPMLAKVIARGRTRDEARRKLIRALEKTALHGLVTNQRFLIDVLQNEAFAGGEATTRFLEEVSPTSEAPDLRGLAAILLSGTGPFWRSSGEVRFVSRMTFGETTEEVEVTAEGPDRFVASGVSIERVGPDRFIIDGIEQTILATVEPDRVHLTAAGHTLTYVRAAPSSAAGAEAADGSLLAPMAGKVVEVRAKAGAAVERGQILVILEAMKMQLELTATVDGTIETVSVAAGDQVDTRQRLVEITKV